MGKFWRVYRYVAFGFVFLLAVGVTGLMFYTHTDGFREFMRRKISTVINESIQGKISIARLEGSVWGSLVVVDLRLRDNEHEILRIPRLKINYFVLPLILGELRVFRLQAAQPQLRLSEGADGVWDIVAALSSSEPQAETSGLAVSISSLKLENADVVVSSSGRTYRALDLDIQGSAGIGPHGVKVKLQQMSSRVLTEGLPEARVKGGLAYQDSGGRESLSLSDFAVESGNSGLSLSGEVNDLKTFETIAKISIDKLAPADVARFVPQWPVKTIVSGAAEIHGPLTALHADFSLSAADGSLSGDFQADLTQDLPVYQGMVRITGVNLARLLERKELGGILTGRVEATGKGFALANIKGEAQANVRAAQVAAWNLGDVSITTTLAQSEAKTSGQLKSELGHADWQGQIALKDFPRYELNFSANQLNIAKISAGRAIEGNLNLTGSIKGSGLTLAGMNALAKIDLERSRLGEVELEQGTLVATIADQRIRVTQGTLRAKDAMLSIKGDMGTDLKQRGQIDYQLRVRTLTPWLALIDRHGSGSVNLAGEAKGNLNDLKTQGKMTFNLIDFEGTAIKGGAVGYDLGYSSSRPLPSGVLKISLSDIQRGYRLQSLDGMVRILAQTPPRFDFDVKARDARNRVHSLSAQLDYQPGHVVARVARLNIDLPDGAWRLAQPVTVEQREQDFFVDRLLMRNNGRELLLEGQFSLTGNQALQLKVEKLPIEGLRVFFPEMPDVTGILSAQFQLGGTAATPQVVAALSLENSKIAGYSYAGLVASGSYRDQRADLKATVRQDQLHTLSATATVPMTLSWNNGWRAEVEDKIDSRIQSSGLNLAFVNAFAGNAIQGIGGEVEVDLRVRGSLNQPVTTGVLRLRDGKFTPTALGVQISSISAEGLLEPSRIRVSQISARANKGEINGSGFITLQKFVPQGIDFSISAKQWPAINTQRYQIEVNGAAKIGGTLAAPRINGSFEVPRGELRPDLSFLDRSSTPVKRDPTITVVSKTASSSPAAKEESKDQAESEIWRNTTIDMQVRIPDNLWLRHRNANVELSGDLRVIKTSGGNPRLTGIIQSVRGWMVFQGRRFTLTRGRLEFTGDEKIEPALDIEAEYRVSNYLVTVIVKGTSEKPTLTLASSPQLDQADILSLLLFNKPVSALNTGEQASLQENAIGIVGGFAATKIGQAVAESLGLQNLGVDIGSIDFSGEAVRFGQYVGRDTFISVSQEISGKYGREVAAEYQITSDWRFSVSSSTTGPDGVDLIWQKRY
jgi:translocation and assembly module TamB